METEKRPGTDEVINELLVKLFKNIMEIEERCLITPEFKDISVNDMHIIHTDIFKFRCDQTSFFNFHNIFEKLH